MSWASRAVWVYNLPTTHDAMRFELFIPALANTVSRLLALALLSAVMILCSGAANDPCSITTAITPPNATADHSADSPGNEAQFSASSDVKGNCPMIPDIAGAWSTSDPENTTISNDPATAGLAVCQHETPTPATITYSGRVRGRTFPSATLDCK